MKIAINKQYGGFSLSDKAFEKLLQLKGIEFEKIEDKNFDQHHYYAKGHAGNDEYYLSHYEYDEPRNDPDLIAVIEELGEEANGFASSLTIVEIPDDVEWQVEEYDGLEWIAEKHRRWG